MRLPREDREMLSRYRETREPFLFGLPAATDAQKRRLELLEREVAGIDRENAAMFLRKVGIDFDPHNPLTYPKPEHRFDAVRVVKHGGMYGTQLNPKYTTAKSILEGMHGLKGNGPLVKEVLEWDGGDLNDHMGHHLNRLTQIAEGLLEKERSGDHSPQVVSALRDTRHDVQQEMLRCVREHEEGFPDYRLRMVAADAVQRLRAAEDQEKRRN